MRTQHCDKCPKVTIGGLEHQALCDECLVPYVAHHAALCRNSPGTEDVDPHRPEHMTFLEWYRAWFAGGHCEPRRWLPQRWIACGEKLPVMSVERDISMQHERNAYMIGSWVVRKYDHGTCTPGVGPACETGDEP